MSAERGRGADASSTGGETRIGPAYYDESDYFEDASEHLHDLESRFQRYRAEKVIQIYQPGKEDRVLDLGCGWGTFTFLLAPRVKEVVGLDFSEKSIRSCRSRARDRRLDNVRFLQADAGDTGLDDEIFDVVIAADLVEHLYPDQTEDVLDECARILKRGGRLVVWTPHRGHILEALRNRNLFLRKDPSHVDYKSMERLRRLLLDRGFSIEKAYYAESHVPLLQELERNLMAFFPLLRRRIAMLARKR